MYLPTTRGTILCTCPQQDWRSYVLTHNKRDDLIYLPTTNGDNLTYLPATRGTILCTYPELIGTILCTYLTTKRDDLMYLPQLRRAILCTYPQQEERSYVLTHNKEEDQSEWRSTPPFLCSLLRVVLVVQLGPVLIEWTEREKDWLRDEIVFQL